MKVKINMRQSLSLVWMNMNLRFTHGLVIRSLLVSCPTAPSVTFVNIVWLSQTPVSCLSDSDTERPSGNKIICHNINKVTEHHAVYATMMQQSPVQSHVYDLWGDPTHLGLQTSRRLLEVMHKHFVNLMRPESSKPTIVYLHHFSLGNNYQ